ncbi:MAG: ribonuclease HII [Candidatus Staskawiczbacteria bacterium RIFOXYB2_FULL_32_9]|uniref:Ribonuclease n=1 Tax=Candidatus Staskawiczbacteria bacterium RIFOXYD1_FULL_32_13 TaxID=1802234 RepID=A0A1G2JML8_9BACT|nr:MAG: Ribonuclease HII [Parcubacteria group bacterium GW2011_GWC2_32_10]OGZ79279.1 MAG: ribonuclease HII [Candidatus Staskawiczbacteria bacterium RIFOXYB1_FULL_32_11]OGZ83580.1 MAG: ribonuclease HII [Candidatus Staskawiczbacteria bacterium RIFOXYB2_FULL_32_9]OGZ88312.1 MAG: ribonuclease HII [Candidatus Staskawiczbacteria bacterium RIFOXYD1_FULL_32_13]
MEYPNFKEENKLYKKGYDIVIGVDEVGRGPLAGPVVACAVCVLLNGNLSLRGGLQTDEAIQSEGANSRLPRSPFGLARNDGFFSFDFSVIKDSKQLSEKQREEIYERAKICKDIEYGLGIVSEKIIDKINILQATKLAMQKAVKNLYKKMIKQVSHKSSDRHICAIVLVDGNMEFDENWFGKDKFGEIKYKSIVKGDQKVFSIALASIIAKVHRDRLMKKYAKKYLQYGFELHKGYGTKLHYENLVKHGACKLHRKTFLRNIQ